MREDINDTSKVVSDAFYRSAQIEKFLNLLYGKITAKKYSYLWTLPDRITYPFDVTSTDEKRAIAQKAVELSDAGKDVYLGINLTDKPCAKYSRPKGDLPKTKEQLEEAEKSGWELVTTQVALLVDIDVLGGNHTDPNKYPPTFDEAKSFLPFPLSVHNDSGHGLHGFAILDTPIEITDSNRSSIVARNKKLLDFIRKRAGKFAGAIDAVHDLPRIMRLPYTRNFKTIDKVRPSVDVAPMAFLVEDTGIRFSFTDLDEKLKALEADSICAGDKKKAVSKVITPALDDPDYKEFRVRCMLEYINVADGEYDKWLSVGFALFNEGFDCNFWIHWSLTQPEFKEGECESKWRGFHYDPKGYSIASLYRWAVEGGYDEKETYQKWRELHPDFGKNSKDPAQAVDDLKAALCEVNQKLADFDDKVKAATELLSNVENFDSDTVFSEEIIQAAAYAFDTKEFTELKAAINARNRKVKDKVEVHKWNTEVKDRAKKFKAQRADFEAQLSKLQAAISSRNFFDADDILKGFSAPYGYSVTEAGIYKLDDKGRTIALVCRHPVFISGKIYDVEAKTYKLKLVFMDDFNQWKSLTASEGVVANSRKLVDLAEKGFPVTSTNANFLVDYLDAFKAFNGNVLSLDYSVARCGWYEESGQEYFIDPRRDCVLTKGERIIRVEVDKDRSDFANHLKRVGSLDAWLKAYDLAKKSPVARLMVDAAIAAPLLKPLGERNFLLYLWAKTRAGKTTALYLGASAIGSEKIIRSFNGTLNALVAAAAEVCDYSFFVDEKEEANRAIKDRLLELVYDWGNGRGKLRLNKDSAIRKVQDWRTIVIMTGESAFLDDNATGGAHTRLLTIKASDEILSKEDCATIRDTIKDNYGQVFPLVVDEILELGRDTLRGLYKTIQNVFTENFPSLLNEHCRYMAVLTLADALLNSALFDIEINTAILNATACAVEIIPMIPTKEEIDATTRERNFVLDFIAQNQPNFFGGNKEPEYMQKVFGSIRRNAECSLIVASALKDACDKAGWDYHKLVDDLAAIGFFVTASAPEKGRKTPTAVVTKRLGKVLARCLQIKNTFLVDLYDSGDE